MAELTDAGFLGDTLDQVEDGFDQEFTEVFGAGVDLSPQGYTGREIPIISRSIVQLQGLTQETLAALDPDNAQGRQLDAIGRLLVEPRNAATKSTIPVQLVGVPGVLVGDKRVRYRRNDTLWRTPQLDANGDPLAISANGFLSTTLTATTTGNVQAFQDGTQQWVIVDEVVGWQSVESVGDYVPGTTAQGDPAYRVLLRAAGRGSGAGTEPGVQRALLGVDGLQSLRLLNNRENFPVDGVPGKFAEAVTDGGEPSLVAQVILDSYGGTDGFAGTREEPAVDAQGNTRMVRYTPVTRIPLVVDVSINTTGAEAELPDDAENLVISVVSQRVNTLGEGINVLPDDLAAQVRNALPAGSIPEDQIKVTIGLKDGPPPADAVFAINTRQKARTTATAQAAEIVGTEFQTFVFDVDWNLDVAVDGDGGQTITFSIGDFANTGAATAAEVSDAINRGSAGLAAGSELGAVAIASNTLGASSSINVLPTTSLALLTALGLAVGTETGTDGDVAVSIT